MLAQNIALLADEVIGWFISERGGFVGGQVYYDIMPDCKKLLEGKITIQQFYDEYSFEFAMDSIRDMKKIVKNYSKAKNHLQEFDIKFSKDVLTKELK